MRITGGYSSQKRRIEASIDRVVITNRESECNPSAEPPQTIAPGNAGVLAVRETKVIVSPKWKLGFRTVSVVSLRVVSSSLPSRSENRQ